MPGRVMRAGRSKRRRDEEEGYSTSSNHPEDVSTQPWENGAPQKGIESQHRPRLNASTILCEILQNRTFNTMYATTASGRQGQPAHAARDCDRLYKYTGKILNHSCWACRSSLLLNSRSLCSLKLLNRDDPSSTHDLSFAHQRHTT